jgi:DedD protein
MMERALKERIIGAAVLVLFVVLVVPVFLDGPPSDAEIVSERLLLPGQDGQKTQTVVLDRDRTDPVPATRETPKPAAAQPAVKAEVKAEPKAEPKPEPKPAATPAQPLKSATQRDEPAAPPTAAPTRVSSTGMWAVQLGSFSNKDNADRLAAELRKQGYAAFLSQLKTESGQLHRVRIGPQKDRDSAEEMAGRLLKVGHKGQVVPHP